MLTLSMVKRFFNDLLYGYPAFSNLKWQIRENHRIKIGYWRMDKIPLSVVTKYGEIITHLRREINVKDMKKLLKAIKYYNEVIDKI